MSPGPWQNIYFTPRELDFINLMSYDLHGAWDKYAGHNSPLYKHPQDTGLQTDYNIVSGARRVSQNDQHKIRLMRWYITYLVDDTSRCLEVLHAEFHDAPTSNDWD